MEAEEIAQEEQEEQRQPKVIEQCNGNLMHEIMGKRFDGSKVIIDGTLNDKFLVEHFCKKNS